MKKTLNREEWLLAATAEFRKAWAKVGVVVPADVKMSCGFPGGGSVLKRIGECWPRSRSAAKVNQVFINPTQSDSTKVADILAHELLHAVDDCKSGHGRDFTRNSKLVGFSGGKYSHAETPEAHALIALVIARLGAYPHGILNAGGKKSSKSDGLQKYECDECGDVLYTTLKKAEVYGVPCCRGCDSPVQMVNAKRRDKKVVTTI